MMISSQSSATSCSNVAQVATTTPTTTTAVTTTAITLAPQITTTNTLTNFEAISLPESSSDLNCRERDFFKTMPSNNNGCLEETVAEMMNNSNDEQSSLRAQLQTTALKGTFKSGKREQQQHSETLRSNKRRKQQNPSRKQSGEWSSGSDIETPKRELIPGSEGKLSIYMLVQRNQMFALLFLTS